jgi:hypothetical protein
MLRVRLGWLVAVSAVFLAGACGSAPAAAPPVPPAPTAPVGADGRPITTLCDLLASRDFTAAGVAAASAPDTSAATATTADCAYGDRIRFAVWVLPDALQATTLMRTQAAGLVTTQDSPVAGVDQSVYGADAQSDTVMLRRRNLVVRISVPAVPDGGKVTLIRLAAAVLTRANALGT